MYNEAETAIILCGVLCVFPGALIIGDLLLRITVIRKIVNGIVRDIRAGRSIFR